MQQLFDSRESLHAPHLVDVDVEVTQAVRRFTIAGEIDEERGRQALSDLADFPVRRYAHDVLLPRVWALRNSLTAHDAVYVALAEALDAQLLTRGARLATAAGHHAQVELVSP